MAFTAEIIGVGTELLLGNTANTDAQDVSQTLSELGINVYFHTVVGDNPARLKQAVEIAKNRADIIITTGGLGPTFDDLTKQTLAEAFGKKLVFNEIEAQKLRNYFENRLHSIKMTDNNLRQVEFPEGSTILHNSIGTAPGCAFEADGKHVLMLPGPPRECRLMLKEQAVPYLMRLSGQKIHSRNIHIFGMGESTVEDKLRGLMESLQNPTLAPYAKEGEVMLRLTARAGTTEEAEALMRPVLEQVRETLGDVIYGIDTNNLESTVANLLKQHNLTLAVAESCTGGLLAKRLTDVPGVSQVFFGGVVTYSTRSKTALLGVPEALINEKGVISSDVALAMADGVREKFGADIGIGITGLAGPGADSVNSAASSGADGSGDIDSGLEPGTVFVALTTKNASFCASPNKYTERWRVRTASSSKALDMIRRFLTGISI